MEGYFSMEEAQAKLAKAMDPNDEYSYDDFMKEYDGNSLPTNKISKINIGFVNQSDNQDPDWETSGSAGFDLRSSENGSIKPNEFKVVPTGLFFDLPENFEIQIRPRSGLAAKHGVTVLNSPGTIDSDYTGEIKVILINHGQNTFEIAAGDRIAQAVITTVTAKNIIQLNKVSSIDKDTERGTGGFGSTGVK
jgi:dUTP pyrophosphatase